MIGMVASSLLPIQSIPGTFVAVSEGVIAARRYGNANRDGQANARDNARYEFRRCSIKVISFKDSKETQSDVPRKVESVSSVRGHESDPAHTWHIV